MDALVSSRLLDAWERALDAPARERPLRMAEQLLRAGAASAADAEPEAGAVAGLTLGERDRRLLDLREHVFGRAVEGLTPCPSCGQSLEVSFDVDALRAGDVAGAPGRGDAGGSAVPGRLVRWDGWSIRVRPLVHDDLVAAAKWAGDAAGVRRGLLERCIVEMRHGDAPVDPADLPAGAERAVAEALGDADRQAAIELALDCPACGASWRAPFDVAAFLWIELDAWSRRTLDGVHRLASAYGWTEADVLALGPARRAHYLALVGP